MTVCWLGPVSAEENGPSLFSSGFRTYWDRRKEFWPLPLDCCWRPVGESWNWRRRLRLFPGRGPIWNGGWHCLDSWNCNNIDRKGRVCRIDIQLQLLDPENDWRSAAPIEEIANRPKTIRQVLVCLLRFQQRHPHFADELQRELKRKLPAGYPKTWKSDQRPAANLAFHLPLDWIHLQHRFHPWYKKCNCLHINPHYDDRNGCGRECAFHAKCCHDNRKRSTGTLAHSNASLRASVRMRPLGWRHRNTGISNLAAGLIPIHLQLDLHLLQNQRIELEHSYTILKNNKFMWYHCC